MSILTDAKNNLVKIVKITMVCSDLCENLIKSSWHNFFKINLFILIIVCLLSNYTKMALLLNKV